MYIIAQSYCYLISQWPLQDLIDYLKTNKNNLNSAKSIASKERNLQGLRSVFTTVFKK
jgi:hypothetical protein